jgi:GNAT superfamily N-acetyltransferase
MRIRPATLEDAPEVARLSAQFAAYLSSLGGREPGPLTEEAYRRDGFGARPRFSGLVAQAEGRLLGYLLHHPGYDVDLCAPVTHVIDLFVDPEARGRGVGRGLIAAVSETARADGSAELIWTVYGANRLAFAFYEGIGAERVRDLALMRLRL